jgi:hypothetical protein
MATPSMLKPVSPIASTTAPDPTTQKLADLEARLAALEGVLSVGSSGVVTLKSGSNIVIDAGMNVTIKSMATTTIQSSGAMSVQASGTLTMKGSTINLN